MKWLRNLGLSVTETKVELFTIIRKYQRYKNLIKKLKITASPASTLDIQPSTAIGKWNSPGYLLTMLYFLVKM